MTKYIRRKYWKMTKIRKINIYLAVFGTALAGAELFGVSFGKICLFPMLIGLLLETKGKGCVNKNAKWLMCFYYCVIIGSAFGLISIRNNAFQKYSSKLLLNLIQYVCIYIPLLLMIGNAKVRKRYTNDFWQAIVCLARIEAIWGCLQFIMWNVFDFNLNDFVFLDILHGQLGSNWVSYSQSFETGYLIRNLRISGLSFENALFGFVLLIGYLIDDNKLWKLFYSLMIILSLSRSSLVTLFIVVIYQLLHSDLKISKNTFLKIIGTILAIILVIIIGISDTDYLDLVLNQLSVFYSRFLEIKVLDKFSGSYRHLMYIPWCIYTWFITLNPFEKLFGVGLRTSGVAFNLVSSIKQYLPVGMQNYAWAIECDVADVLLGTGICGLLSLYSFLIAKYKMIGDLKLKSFVICVLAFGLMYNVSSWNLTILMYIFIAQTETIMEDKYGRVIQKQD